MIVFELKRRERLEERELKGIVKIYMYPCCKIKSRGDISKGRVFSKKL